MSKLHPHTLLGTLCVIFAVVFAFLWIPFDIDSGIVETKRGKFVIGDSLAPALSATVFFVTGILLLLGGKPENATGITWQNFKFLGAILALVAIGLLVLRFAGPLITSLVSDESYRTLRNTTPYKHIGFVLGGTFMVSGLISLVEARVSWRAVIIGIVASLGIILLYDVPFEDLLLPPNGDV